MAQRIGKYKVSKKDRALAAVDGGSEFSGDLTGITAVTSATLTTSGNLTVGTNLKGGTDAGDNILAQVDGTEVARIHDGGVEPTHAGTSTSFTAHTGFGWRRRVLTLGSGHADNVLSLGLVDSGCVVFVTPTNAITINLPTIGTETGWWCTIVVADKIDNGAFTIQTTVQDGNDNIMLQNTSTQGEATTPFTFDVGGGHDQLVATDTLEGTKIELTNVAGGAAEVWLANVISTDTVLATIS